MKDDPQNREAAPLVFVSYARADKAVAMRFKEWLEVELKLTCFFDISKLDGDADSQNDIVEAAKGCCVALVLLTSESVEREWVSFEIGCLKGAGRPLIPIKLAERDSHAVESKLFLGRNYRDWSTAEGRVGAFNDLLKYLPSDVVVQLRKGRENYRPFTLEPIARDEQLACSEFNSRITELRSRLDKALSSIQRLLMTQSGSRRALAILNEYILPRTRQKLVTALSDHYSPLSLPSDIREKVAKELIDDAKRCIIAVSIVSNDKWFYGTPPKDNDYLEVNRKAAKRLVAEQAPAPLKEDDSDTGFPIRRLIVVKRKADLSRIRPIIDEMVLPGVALKWCTEANLLNWCRDAELNADVQNLLIVDSFFMTESRGHGHGGMFIEDRGEIGRAINRFNNLWSRASWIHPNASSLKK